MERSRNASSDGLMVRGASGSVLPRPFLVSGSGDSAHVCHPRRGRQRYSNFILSMEIQ